MSLTNSTTKIVISEYSDVLYTTNLVDIIIPVLLIIIKYFAR